MSVQSSDAFDELSDSRPTTKCIFTYTTHIKNRFSTGGINHYVRRSYDHSDGPSYDYLWHLFLNSSANVVFFHSFALLKPRNLFRIYIQYTTPHIKKPIFWSKEIKLDECVFEVLLITLNYDYTRLPI